MIDRIAPTLTPTDTRPAALALVSFAFAAALAAASLVGPASDAQAATRAEVGNAGNSYANITVETRVTAPQVCTTGAPGKKPMCTLKPGLYLWTMTPGEWSHGVGTPSDVTIGARTRVYLPKGCRRWASSSYQSINAGWNTVTSRERYVSFRVWGCK